MKEPNISEKEKSSIRKQFLKSAKKLKQMADKKTK